MVGGAKMKWVNCSDRMPIDVRPPELIVVKWTHPQAVKVFAVFAMTANQLADKLKIKYAIIDQYQWLDES